MNEYLIIFKLSLIGGTIEENQCASTFRTVCNPITIIAITVAEFEDTLEMPLLPKKGRGWRKVRYYSPSLLAIRPPSCLHICFLLLTLRHYK